MKRNLSDLKIKSFNELTIPNQLQGCVDLIDLLTNSQLDDSTICEIFKLINNYSITPGFIESLLHVMSRVFPHKCTSLSNIGEMMQKRKIINTFSIFEHFGKEFETPLMHIVRSVIDDKVDEIVAEIEKETFDINQVLYEVGIQNTLINIACKYGAENCFALLKLKGAKISDKTSIYAVEGGNKNIILSLYNDTNFKITDKHLTAALKYHHNDIFEWLLETQGSIGDLNAAECFYYLNIKGLLFLLGNGFSINCEYIFQILFIIIIIHSSIIFVYHYYNGFITHICVSL